MAQQIRFFRKSFADFERTYVTATASNSPGQASQVFARSNRTGWGTFGSNDAENTTFTINLGDTPTFDSLLLINHNWKNYKIQYLASDGVTWTDFSPTVNPTTSNESTTLHTVPSTISSGLKATIYGTQVPNAEKFLSQFIVSKSLGQFNSWPIIKDPILGRALQEQGMLSGLSNILQNKGRYSASLIVDCMKNSADLALVETLFQMPEGFLFWPGGGDETQFSSVRMGYRKQDIYLVRCKNEFKPEFYKGAYFSGMAVRMDLVEVIT